MDNGEQTTASSSPGRPTKRMRTAKKQPQAAQTQQVAAAGSTVAYSSPNRIDLAQGVAGLNQGGSTPSGQPNNLNHNTIDQTYQAINFADLSLNHHGSVQSEQQNHLASSFVDFTQVDGANHPAHDAAVIHNEHFGPQQTQPDASRNIWTEFVSNLGMEAMDLEIPINPALQGGAGTVNTGHLHLQIPMQPSQNQQAMQSQEHTPVQQQLVEAPIENAEEFSDSYFGELAPLVRFNAEN